MKNRKIFFLMSLVLALVLALAACSGDNNGNNANDGNKGNNDSGDNNSSDTASGGDLIISLGSDVVSLSTQGSNDVPSSNVAENIYETLVVLDENQEIQAGLAESWEPIDDVTWEFKLREGVKFHDGSDLTAEVIKANFERLLDKDVGSPRAFLLETVVGMEAVDELTFRLTLDYPYSPILSNLTHNGTAIMSPKTIEEDYAQMANGGDPDAYINQKPSGTGPFKFKSWTPGASVVLEKFDGYWGDKAKLDTVTFKVVPEQSARVAELETGGSHVVDAIGPNNVDRVNSGSGISVVQEPSTSLSYVGFNTQKAPFDNVKVRQAISMAINKDVIIDGVYNGIGIPAVGPLAPPVFGYDENVPGIEFNVERAKELLEEAGYGDGFSTTIWTNDNEQRVDTAIAIQAQLKEIGIDLKIEEVEWGAYLERTANGEHDMFILGWSVVTSDADYGMYPLFHSSAVGDPGNRSFLENADLDKLLDDARRATDADERLALYSQAQEMLVELAPMLYIHHQEYLLGVSDSVKDFSIDAQGIYQIKQAYIQE